MSNYTTEQVTEILLGDYDASTQLITKLYKGRKELPYELKFISLDNKVKILDKHTQGKSKYVFSLLRKFNTDKESIPKDEAGRVKTVSLKAWIKKNVDDNIIRVDNKYKYGEFRFLGIEHYIQRYFDYRSDYEYNTSDYRERLFEGLIGDLKLAERKWYRENNPLIQKINELKEHINLSIFDSKILNDIKWNGKENITEEQAEFYIGIGKEFEAFEKALAEKVAKYEIDNDLI